MPDINMPKLSDTMEEGTIVEWKKKSGDTVKKGEVLAEVESDKATFDLESEADGVLKILVEQGVPAKIGAPIASIGEGGEEPSPAAQESKPAAAPAPKAEPRPQAKKAEAPEAPPAPPSPAPSAPAGDGRAPADVRASPLAKRLAAERGGDLSTIKGSGPHGRSAKEDTEAAAGA